MVRFPAKRGSQKWIQKLVNEMPDLLNSKIREALKLSEGERILWLSPLKDDDYTEYHDQDFINRLDVKLKKIPLANFWPKGGPQWDALGRSNQGKLFLVEAKSHIPELVSTLRAKEDISRKMIRKRLMKTKKFLNSSSPTDWSRGFYQYANRLAHLYFLREKNRLPAYLVFVYFVNDFEMKGPATVKEWKAAKRLMHSYLGVGRHRLQKFIADVFIDVKHLH